MSFSGGHTEAQEDCHSTERNSADPLKILTLASVFPNPKEPHHGTFIRYRMQAVAKLATVKVIAPVAAVDYSNPDKEWFGNRSVAMARQDGDIEVLHPRWLFPPFGTPWNGPCMYWALAGMIEELRKRYPFDILDAHFGFPDGLAAARLAERLRCPFVLTLRGNEPIFGHSSWHRRAMSEAFRKASRVLGVSERLRQYAVELGADPARTRTVPNGIDADFFYPRDREGCRSRLGLASGTPMILSAGRLVEAKGHHLIIQALRRMKDRGVDARLLLAGGACREDRFEQTIRRTVTELDLEKDVAFLGHVPKDQMVELMSAADVVCLASFAEGWPNVVTEAQACGAPLVSTSVGGVPDMIPSDKFGFMVPVKSVEALDSALTKALSREWDRKAISEWGRSRSWDQVAGEVLEEMRGSVAEHVRN
jgi:glycosyltransferase involved in cell wall biosynthesis